MKRSDSPFNDFKFNIGDVVYHKAGTGGQFVITQRYLMDGCTTYRWYVCQALREDGALIAHQFVEQALDVWK